MVPGLVDGHAGRLDSLTAVLVAIGLLAALCFAGAAAAGVQLTSPQITPGRAVTLSIFAAILVLVGIGLVLVGYWLWRFTVEFTF